MQPPPRRLVLELLSAAPDEDFPVAALLAAAGLFGVKAGTMRVALARLVAADLVVSPERGVYRLGDAARPLQVHVARWRTREREVRRWRGGWIGIVPHAEESREARRGRARALELMGVRALQPRLLVRPDNLAEGVAGVRERLAGLGLRDATVFGMRDLDPGDETMARSRWDTAALDRGYRRGLATIERLEARLATMDPADGAREAFLVGSAAIHRIIFDPLLPAPLVDAAARRAHHDAMLRLDRTGRALWRRLLLVDFETRNARARRSPTGHAA